MELKNFQSGNIQTYIPIVTEILNFLLHKKNHHAIYKQVLCIKN